MSPYRIVSVFAITLVVMLLSNTAKADLIIDIDTVNDSSIMYFPLTVHQYDTLVQGIEVECYFSFENTGNIPIIISKVDATCGCTTTFWPDRPILPGEVEEICIIYDAEKTGEFYKSITVWSNAGKTILHVKGVVVE